MRDVVNAASVAALGGPIPREIRVTVDNRQKRIILLGPAASGKTRIAQAVPIRQRHGWRCYSGLTPDSLHREWPR